jgi:hypothetical protein
VNAFRTEKYAGARKTFVLRNSTQTVPCKMEKSDELHAGVGFCCHMGQKGYCRCWVQTKFFVASGPSRRARAPDRASQARKPRSGVPVQGQHQAAWQDTAKYFARRRSVLGRAITKIPAPQEVTRPRVDSAAKVAHGKKVCFFALALQFAGLVGYQTTVEFLDISTTFE